MTGLTMHGRVLISAYWEQLVTYIENNELLTWGIDSLSLLIDLSWFLTWTRVCVSVAGWVVGPSTFVLLQSTAWWALQAGSGSAELMESPNYTACLCSFNLWLRHLPVCLVSVAGQTAQRMLSTTPVPPFSCTQSFSLINSFLSVNDRKETVMPSGVRIPSLLLTHHTHRVILRNYFSGFFCNKLHFLPLCAVKLAIHCVNACRVSSDPPCQIHIC